MKAQYKLKCKDCEKFYVGKTSRYFKTRIDEHKRSFDLKDRVSHYANHLIDENHSFDKKFELIDSRLEGRELHFREIVAINKHKNSNNLLNSLG